MDLLREHFAQRTAHDGEVLGEHEHLASVDGSPTGYNTVGVGPFGQSCFVGAVTRQHVELVKRALIEQIVDAFASEHLALVALTLNRPFRSCVDGFQLALLKLFKSAVHW